MITQPIRHVLPYITDPSYGLDVSTTPGMDVAGLPFDQCAGAVFSLCQQYRYLLWRVWNPDLPFWSFGMLNPSTADHQQSDATVLRCCTRAQNGGAGGVLVWNLFAWRAREPAAMKRVSDPVGPANEFAIGLAVGISALNIAAWGAHGTHRSREHRVRSMLGPLDVKLHALAFTKAGLPRHPLYLPMDLQPEPWRYWE